MLMCTAPGLVPDPHDIDYDQTLNYTIVLDNANGPDITQPLLQLTLKRDPVFIEIEESDRMYLINDHTSAIRIKVCMHAY